MTNEKRPEAAHLPMRRRDLLRGATLIAAATLGGAAARAAGGAHEGHHAAAGSDAERTYSEAQAYRRRAAVVAVANE